MLSASSRVAPALCQQLRGLVGTTAGYSTGVVGAAHHAQEGAMASPTNRVTPSKKVMLLKVLSTPKRKLAPQGTGVQMLPPGCSISDPNYSIKDPVYFQDVPSEATK